MQNNNIPERRNDLQCWRAFSIFAVLLFHLWSEITPNGYYGVDIFFILSGYFMAKLYFNRKTFDLSCFGEFYFKRIKRIAPIYFVFITSFIYLLPFSLHEIDSQIALKDFKWATVFLTNFQDRWSNLGYVSETSQYRFFKHCWTLSIEMHFYLIFPFIALIQTKLSHHFFRAFLAILFLASLAFEYTRHNPYDAYAHTLSRIWQFIVGIFAAQHSFEPNKTLCKFLFMVTTCIVFCPIPFPWGLTSFFCAITVAVIICFSSTDYSPFDHLPFYSKIVYLGDISYTLYLIQWPLIAYMKYSNINGRFNFFEGVIIGSSIIMLAIILHEAIEKPLIKHCNDWLRLFSFLIIAYLISYFYIPFTVTNHHVYYSKITQQFIKDVNNFSKPMELPLEWTRQNDIEFGHYINGINIFVGNMTKCDNKNQNFIKVGSGFSHYCEIEKSLTGNLTAMIIGNDYAHNVLPLIASNQHLLKKVTSLIAFNCLYVKYPSNECKGYIKAVNDAIIKTKPDIIYFIQNYGSLNAMINDKLIQNQRNENFKFAFEFFQQHSSVIITNFQHFQFRNKINDEFLRHKKFGFDINLNEKKLFGLSTLDKIQLNLSSSCSKCLWINYNDFFCHYDYCTPIDPYIRLPMFFDESHFTIIGVRRAQNIFNNATKIALTLIKK